MKKAFLNVLVAVAAAGCATPPQPDRAPPPLAPSQPSTPATTPPEPVAPTPPVTPVEPPSTKSEATYRQVAWDALPDWRSDDVAEAWSAYRASCGVLRTRPAWRSACEAAARLTNPDTETARRHFETHYSPWQIRAGESETGLVTGYYEPLLRGSRTRSERYRFPLYRVPPNLLTIELTEVHPELKGKRVRGRIDGRRIVPFYDRAQIDGPAAPLRGHEIVWVDDALDAFFLHVQGSGRVVLDSGDTVRVGYADQNGHPYRAIGRVLVDRGALRLEDVSMQEIKSWAARNAAEAPALLAQNPSYVFFRELPPSDGGPPGSLGVPLTAQRSLAVDRRHVPLGAPVYVATRWPRTERELNRLMVAQDTGGAIAGAVRADFFWGSGEDAALQAGRMREPLRMWILLPKGMSPP